METVGSDPQPADVTRRVDGVTAKNEGRRERKGEGNPPQRKLVVLRAPGRDGSSSWHPPGGTTRADFPTHPGREWITSALRNTSAP